MIEERSGHISLSVFQTAIENLYDMLTCFSDSTAQWSMENYPGYEYSELVCHRFESPVPSTPHVDGSCSSADDLKLEYRISYSVAYEVPILMMRIQNFSGRPLSIELLKKRFIRSIFQSTKNHYVALEAGFSQVEHPYLGIPYYQFHPCRTAGLMRQALSVENAISEISGVKYLILWLSLIATPAGLMLPNDFAAHNFESDSNTMIRLTFGDHVRI